MKCYPCVWLQLHVRNHTVHVREILSSVLTWSRLTSSLLWCTDITKDKERVLHTSVCVVAIGSQCKKKHWQFDRPAAAVWRRSLPGCTACERAEVMAAEPRSHAELIRSQAPGGKFKRSGVSWTGHCIVDAAATVPAVFHPIRPVSWLDNYMHVTP